MNPSPAPRGHVIDAAEDAPRLRRRLLDVATLADDPSRRADAEDAARALLADLDPAGAPIERVTARFAAALGARLREEARDSGNLYAAPDHGPADMIGAFQTLVEETPLVRFGHRVADAALLAASEGARDLHLIDIGIGQGSQWEPFLAALGLRDPTPRVRLTGIDIPTPDDPRGTRLRGVGQRLSRVAHDHGLPFLFRPLAAYIEDVDAATLAGGAGGATTLVNAAFALHHTPAGDGVTDPGRSRDAVLARVAALEPAAFTLVEPDVEHNALPLIERVAASFDHYALVFHALGTALAQAPHRDLIEEAFFGREIFNVVAHEGPARVERHEAWESWARRMRSCGFRARPPPDPARIGRALDLAPPFSLDGVGDAVALEVRGQPIVAASTWAVA